MTTPAPIKRKKDSSTTLALTLKFVTPMFGGGTYTNAPGEGSQHKDYDHETPVRVSAIRGQLRYWWRATSGAWLDSVAKMKAREDEIFGTTSKPGLITIWADAAASELSPTEYEVFETYASRSGNQGVRAKQDCSALAYGAFSLTPTDKDSRGGKTDPGALHDFGNKKFSVTFRWTDSSLDEELKLAVSAFVAFGGLGGRTTRGFGQLASVGGSGLLSAQQVLAAVKAKGTPNLGDQIPAIDPTSVEVVNSGNLRGAQALNAALNKLRKFRQEVGFGRNKGQQPNRPGRSRWPEPDAIRIVTRRNASEHRPDAKYSKVQKFPRAAFGMPIIFHFKDERAGDPSDQTLQPVGKERMRSPLQIAIDDDGNATYLVMTAPRPSNVELKDTARVDWQLTEEELQLYRQRSSAVFTDTDPLKAFLNFVKSGN